MAMGDGIRKIGAVTVGLLMLPGISAGTDIYTELPPQLSKYDTSALVHVSSKAEAESVRQRVIKYFWPNGELPTKKRPAVSEVYAGHGPFPTEIRDINGELVKRVQLLDVDVAFDYHHKSYLLHAASPTKRRRLVILHMGHIGGLGDGVGVLANRLLKKGFNVLLMQMPLVGWNTDKTFKISEKTITVHNHNQLIATLEGRGGSSLRFFIEPVVVGINYFIDQNPDYQDVSMIGYSGGGWTVNIAAALDHRIRLSVPVAGSYPLYLRPYYPGSTGDAEQILPALYKERASWLDLYILGGYGKGRTQIQVVNQFDSVCFYGIGYTTYEATVSRKVGALGGGQWHSVLDSSHKKHLISTWTMDNVIEPALEGSMPVKQLRDRTEPNKPDSGDGK